MLYMKVVSLTELRQSKSAFVAEIFVQEIKKKREADSSMKHEVSMSQLLNPYSK